MQMEFWQNVLVVFVWISYSTSKEEIICSTGKMISCTYPNIIRVHDVIYGHVVGRNECNTQPTSNCTAPNGFCDVAEQAEGKSSQWLRAKWMDLNPLSCGRTGIYIIINYSCLKTPILAGENFAFGKPARQTSTTHNGVASRAVDGKLNKYYYSNSCTHTAKETSPWWRVDLEQRIAVTHVKIVNRDALGKRLCGFEIRIGDKLSNNGATNMRCGTQQHIAINQFGIVSCKPTVVGRYVTVVIPGRLTILTLCEVEVYGRSILGNQNLTEVQLIGSNLPYEGYVILNGSTFCDPMWSRNDAQVSCIQLGYLGITNSLHWNNSYFGNGGSFPEGMLLERRYNCSGSEGSLKDCPQTVDKEKTCERQNAVSVICQPYVRLRGSDIPLEGRVEVFHQGTWGTICSYSSDTPRWDKPDALVACRELGFHDVVRYGRWTGQTASGKVWLRYLGCKGNEKSLAFCSHNNWKYVGCHHFHDRYVKCSICSDGLLKDMTSFPSSVFNASASRPPEFVPSSARLYSPHPWCLPDTHIDDNQFLEISLPGIFSLSAVATVGGKLGYVTSYMLSYDVSGYSWKFATVGKQQLIYGNTNAGTHNVIRKELDSNIHAQKVKFIPKTWQAVPCMRVELCGREIPRCNPPNITVENITANSVLITWFPLRLPKAMNPHKNYSVTITTYGGHDVKYSDTTERTSLFITILSPYRQYTCTVKAAGLEECFQEDMKLNFETKQDAPSAPPRELHVVDLSSTVVTVTWSPPVTSQQNGLITGYQVCYFSARSSTNCSDKNVTRTEVEESPLKIEGLQPATEYRLRIRAKTEAGLGPYSEEIETVTSSGDLLKAEDVNTTAYSFGIQLQQPRKGFSYVQIIVIKLKDKTLPDSPHTYTSNTISTLNESVSVLKPYVTAQLSARQVDQLKIFVIGDGLNYGESPKRRRREAEEFTMRYDDWNEQEKRSKKSDKKALFHNRPLEADSFYSTFQRTFMDQGTYYSSSWSEPIKTNPMTNPMTSPMTSPMTNPGTSERRTSGSGTGTWIGIGVGALILIILIILVFAFLRHKKKRLMNNSGAEKSVRSPETVGSHFNKEVEYDNYDTIQDIKMDELGEDDRDTDSETDAAGGIVDSKEIIYGNAKVTETRDPFRMVPAQEFESYVRDLKKKENFGFDQQFKQLPQGICYSCTVAKSPENLDKNRYGNIVSYDDALVRLAKDSGETYINASFISGVDTKSYIATQGPTSKTISAFWKMVWEQNSSAIIMLTNLKEKEKVKCAKYWTESSKRFGRITLTFQEKQLYPYYVIRKFLIEKDDIKRYVTQFHFTAWPDHGVPKYPTQLLAFQHAVRFSEQETSGPVIVHCSAGVGRTGTFIVIDHCLENFSRQEEHSVDVFHIVQEMRKRRVNMIQTLEQYILVHEAILEFIQCGFNEVEGDALASVITNLKTVHPKTKQTGFAELFQRLKNLSPVLTKEECKTATLKRNSCKNRTLEIYPADFARVALSSCSSKNGSDYINATFVDGFQQRNAYIATESPMINTFDEFWQMIHEQRSPLVIMLNNWKEGREKYPEYFPSEKGFTIKYGKVYVRLDEHVADKTIVFRKLAISLTSNFESPNIVRHFQYTQWPKRGSPGELDEILQLIQTVQTAQRQNVQGPMVVHCGDGAGRTGTFLTISICMERLKVEHRVDVFQCIKLIREHRPQFVEKESQLQFCYEVLEKFVESFEGYSNFAATD